MTRPFATATTRALLAAAALFAAAASPAAPVVYQYTASGYDGSTVTGSFGWNSDAVASATTYDGHVAYYNDAPATPVGGFLTAKVSGGIFDGAEVSESLKSWQVMDGSAGGVPEIDMILVTSSPVWIWLEDDTGTALDEPAAALPSSLNLADWGSEHRGRLSWGVGDELDFLITSITLAPTTPAAVSEPGSLALAGLAATAALLARRRRVRPGAAARA